MSLVCKPSVVPPPPSTPDATIANDGFFPPVDPAPLRALTRGTPTPERLREAVVGAMLTVNTDLAAWRALQVAAGHATLDAVPAPQLAGASRLVQLYRRAIACLVRAELVERHPDSDLTPAGQSRLEAVGPAIEDLRRDARHAVRDILGRTRTSVELI